MQQFDIVIVGAGTAGLTAAIYALRAGKTVLVTEAEIAGWPMARRTGRHWRPPALWPGSASRPWHG